MYRHRDVKLLLDDRLDAAHKIKQYTSSHSFDVFMTDDKTKDAVIRNFEIIGEAANRMDPDLRARHPEIEWNRIREPFAKPFRKWGALGMYYGMLDKGVRGRSLSSKQKKRNRKLSRVRCRVEHPFAYIKAKLGHRVAMAKTLLRNSLRFDRNCLIYNLMRAHVLLR